MRRSVTVVIVVGCVVALVTLGLRSSLGLFTEPLTATRGWDREAFALAMALQNLFWGLGQPLAGAIADRFGAARVLAAGGAVYALGVALMASSTSEGARASPPGRSPRSGSSTWWGPTARACSPATIRSACS